TSNYLMSGIIILLHVGGSIFMTLMGIYSMKLIFGG
ncbi:MAG: hypothetical protein K1000chlam4_00947, partial [Chlamydiae bacterium]|nr:hypothetical protein [Chlamydiota bacterium]